MVRREAEILILRKNGCFFLYKRKGSEELEKIYSQLYDNNSFFASVF